MIKNKKKFLKIILLPSLSVGLLVATAVPLSLITVNVGSNPLILGFASKEALKDRILTESYKGGQELFYKYDGLMFDSMNELNKYILEKGDVQSQIISSNPLKIIKDYEYGILDETKIFDTNLNNFVQVFENSFGDVAFSEEEALKTYINEGNIREQFSYDGVNWHNSEKEAANAQKQKMKISQSLFYVYNNRYYNAFNIKDINALIANMNNGYYTSLTKNLDGNSASIIKEIVGDKELFGKLLKEYLAPDFVSGYYRQISLVNITNGLEITPKNKHHLKVNGEVINADSSVTLLFPDKYSSLDEMTKHFKKNWTKTLVADNWEYSKNFDLIINNVIFKDVKVILWTDNEKREYYDEDGHFHREYNPQKTDFDKDFNYTTNNSGTIRFYKDKDKREEFDNLVIKNVKNLFDLSLTNDQIMELYKIWFDNYFKDVITNFGLDNNQEVKWQDIKNNIFIKNKSGSFVAGEVYKDKIYEINPGKGYNQSLVRSQMDWEIAKQKIINEAEKEGLPKPKPEDKAYALRPDFKVTKGDLNNFLNLEGNVDARVMYSVSTEEHPSDREGKFLASTEIQAKALKQLYNDDSIKIRYLIFDAYGNEVISNGSDYQSAIKELRSEIKLNSKFIHKKEVEKWPGGYKKKWADIISDGNYLVYSIPNPNNSQKRIWFLSQDGALKNLKVNLKPQTLEEEIYVYNFLNENNILLPIKFKMNEIDNLVDQIYQAES